MIIAGITQELKNAKRLKGTQQTVIVLYGSSSQKRKLFSHVINIGIIKTQLQVYSIDINNLLYKNLINYASDILKVELLEHIVLINSPPNLVCY
jgi:hypothetical protein